MRTLLLAGLVACASTDRIEDGQPQTPAPMAPVVLAPKAPVVAPSPPPPPNCIADGKPYDLAVMKERVTYLASKELEGRVPGTDGDRATRKLLVDKFRCLGLTAAGTDGSFELPFETEGKQTANVVGYIAGTDPDVGDEIIYVGAHHDHEGNGHLGANDNASGIVGLLAVAQAIQQRPAKPKRTIVFAAFGAEEKGMIGSYHLAKNPPAKLPNDKVVQFINLDMIGSHSSRGLVAAMGALPKLASRKFLEKLDDKFPKLSVSIGGRARGSDYEPLCKLGVPYVFFWTPDARCYHQKCDTADRIDYPRMVDIAGLAGALTEQMADTDQDLAGFRAKHGCGV
ncbi:MAG: M20/M25/M40 family metallo-hydrolase [Deltaproteobacteria bacterium]|nr:M20/M25/M40 family metallo-hydrolase [Deltaproteobacteria bacterium]